MLKAILLSFLVLWLVAGFIGYCLNKHAAKNALILGRARGDYICPWDLESELRNWLLVLFGIIGLIFAIQLCREAYTEAKDTEFLVGLVDAAGIEWIDPNLLEIASDIKKYGCTIIMPLKYCV